MIDETWSEMTDYVFDSPEDELTDSGARMYESLEPSMEAIETTAPIDTYIKIGSPGPDGHIVQTTPFTCAVVSQQMILNDFGVVSPGTKQPLSEAELVYVAATHGWLHEGTSPEDAGKLLEHYGVANHHGYGIGNMIEELRQGHKVIVGVDSDELWNANNPLYNAMKDYLKGEGANHAIVVKGIVVDGQNEPMVVVNDPGKPDGAGDRYPLSVFMDAFQDGQCHFVATDDPPPMLADHSLYGHHFDAQIGFYDNPEAWAPYATPSAAVEQARGDFFENRTAPSMAYLDGERRLSLLMEL